MEHPSGIEDDAIAEQTPGPQPHAAAKEHIDTHVWNWKCASAEQLNETGLSIVLELVSQAVLAQICVTSSLDSTRTL